jgi:hypothetical protein
LTTRKHTNFLQFKRDEEDRTNSLREYFQQIQVN